VLKREALAKMEGGLRELWASYPDAEPLSSEIRAILEEGFAEEPLLSVEELGIKLGISPQSIYRSVAAGDGQYPSHLFGVQHRFLLSEAMRSAKRRANSQRRTNNKRH
jgi:predicted DNA-binding transcriptional regulator AlpA